jgi:hypothetical protein
LINQFVTEWDGKKVDWLHSVSNVFVVCLLFVVQFTAVGTGLCERETGPKQGQVMT